MGVGLGVGVPCAWKLSMDAQIPDLDVARSDDKWDRTRVGEDNEEGAAPHKHSPAPSPPNERNGLGFSPDFVCVTNRIPWQRRIEGPTEGSPGFLAGSDGDPVN